MGITICGRFKKENISKFSNSLNSDNLMKKDSKAFSKSTNTNAKKNDSNKIRDVNLIRRISNIYQPLISQNSINNNNENLIGKMENENFLDQKYSQKDFEKENTNLLKTDTIIIGKKLNPELQRRSKMSFFSQNNFRSQVSGISKLNMQNYDNTFLLNQGELACSGIIKKRLMSEKIEKIQKKFFISTERITQLYDCFTMIDINNCGHISILDLYKLIEEHPSTSRIGPFLDRFFVLIEKRNFDKASFEEFLPNLLSFCLFSIYQIIEFVFHFIDKDHDNSISKKDIKNLISLKREDINIYFDNNLIAFENLKLLKRSDKITLEDFVSLCERLPFIYYPAIRLQNLLKEKYIGISFWNNLQKEIKVKYLLNIKSMESEKIQNKIHQIKEKIILEKKEMMKENNKNKEAKIYYQEMRLERRNSDTNFFLVLEKNVINGIQQDEQLEEAKSFNENIIELNFD